MRAKMKEKVRSRPQKISGYQKAILELSERENLDSLKLREIADAIGLEGKHRISYVCRLINNLNQKGLLTTKRRMPAFAVQQV
jgi:hypothetical protein